ncbi:glycosyltransferase [Xylanibacter muris]|uniref:Glycosyltransferase n=2 Tax=Xylanibacter muris TaxID=2736290 RepID=A0ABX2AIK8_9BACT|nr:glycosyltransferase [Xylanibacter muris]NPD90770.1 glycosyltransferase [Xylanibacter muris]
MTIPSFFILIVIYNKNPEESSTIVSLANTDDRFKTNMRCLVCDNSKNELDDTQKRKLDYMLKGLEYQYAYNDGRNKPLSEIYNETIKKLRSEEYLIILDDDSVFDSELFGKCSLAISENKDIDLFLPVIYNNDTVVSPAVLRRFKGHYIKNIKTGRIKCKDITAINSGMIIKAEYLKERFEGYDERIKFYFTDNDFMSKYDSTHNELFVLDYRMNHTLNFYMRGECFEKKKSRFRDLRRSYLILMRRKGMWLYLLTQIYLFVYSIKFSIQQRDIRFIFVF